MKNSKAKIIVLLSFVTLLVSAALIMYFKYVKDAPKKGYIIAPRTEYDPIKVDSALKSQKGYKK